MSAEAVRPNVWEVLHNYVLRYNCPKSVKFCPVKNDHLSTDRVKAHRAAKQLKCTASDGLSLLPVMCFFVQAVLSRVPGIDHNALDALVLLSDLVDALVAVPLGLISVDYLRERIRVFLVACETAGWRPRFIPKFHWLIHLIAALARWGTLPTCWVHERKHRIVKRYGQDNLNTKMYSQSVLAEAISHQLVEACAVSAFDISPGLVNPSKATATEHSFVLTSLSLPSGPDATVLTCSSARLTTGHICFKTNVVLIKSNDDTNFVAGQVWLLFCVEELVLALVSLWDFDSYDQKLGKAVWRMVDRPIFLHVADILCSVIWSETSPGIALTLVPFQFRGLQAVAD